MNKILNVTTAVLLCCGYIVQASEDFQAGETAAQAERDPGATTRRAQASKYLETGGQRKLEVLYKQVSGRDLHLDLYYPTKNRADKCPVVFCGPLLKTHGGRS